MGKVKTKCYLCGNVMKTASDQDTPEICTRCGTNLVDAMEREAVFTAVEKQAGGVLSDVVYILLTNQRLVFFGQAVAGASGGGLIGGAIGGAIAGAMAGAKTQSQPENYVSVPLTELASFTEEVAGLMKNKIELTVLDKSGRAYAMKISKKDAEKIKTELAKTIT